ncbi:hypothetical protein JD844_005549 [Phrynosoma platyrhinos]|uniref:Endothelin-like toxin domain-containing protein n=1 Tax=Phrynosoma platyrhinos TaxID=52577 RepID=A0ABQ7TP77_PHRPL|nr:hypothetical protein JD844_005549 [Phrynosoma platyrhinos]
MLTAPPAFFSLALTLCVLLEEGLSSPPAKSYLAVASSRHLRTKRCSCTLWEDMECIYFCHLDIIWINTPGHAIPYGLGNLQKRQKRTLGRCECLHEYEEPSTAHEHRSVEASPDPQQEAPQAEFLSAQRICSFRCLVYQKEQKNIPSMKEENREDKTINPSKMLLSRNSGRQDH